MLYKMGDLLYSNLATIRVCSTVITSWAWVIILKHLIEIEGNLENISLLKVENTEGVVLHTKDYGWLRIDGINLEYKQWSLIIFSTNQNCSQE